MSEKKDYTDKHKTFERGFPLTSANVPMPKTTLPKENTTQESATSESSNDSNDEK